MQRKEIPVGELEFGMYVAALDRAWEGTPFAYQGFHLRTEAQLEALRKYCTTVHVDVDQDQTAANSVPAPPPPLRGLHKVVYRETVPIERELAPARDVFASSEVVINAALQSSVAGRSVDAVALKTEVTKVTESVLRNPHAAALLSVMREGAEYLVDRAMHSSVYLIMFTRFLGMERADIERAGLVGLLQDVAMARVPHELVMKKGVLTPEEQTLVRLHVQQGVEQITATKGLGPEIAHLAGMHHERFDGSGYPKGLRGADIPTIAACSALVDTYSAMTRARPYAEPMPPSKVLGLLHRWRGKTFHATLVEEFIRCVGPFPVGSVVELGSGEVGIVISQEAEKRLQPRVMVVRDASGKPLRPQRLIDLSRVPSAGNDDAYRIRRTIEYGRSGVNLRDVILQ